MSTIEYYKILNKEVNHRLGGVHSAKIILYSVDFEEAKPPADANNLQPFADSFSAIAMKLENAGASCLLLCANTTHIFADEIQKKINMPLIHIADETGKEIAKHKLTKIGLLGTRITMEHHFFKDKLLRYGIEALVPEEEDRNYIHNSIFTELGKEIFKPETKTRYLQIINKLQSAGAQGVILGCTEIPLLIKQEDCSIVTFDTTRIHAHAGVKFALS